MLTTCRPVEMRMHAWEDPDFKNEKYVVSDLLSGQNPAFPLNCPAILVLEYWSTGNKSQITLPRVRGGICLLPPVNSHYSQFYICESAYSLKYICNPQLNT